MFYAKSNPPISLEQHTQDVVEKAKELLVINDKYYSNSEKNMILLSCRYHDLGKVNSVFQAKLNHQSLTEQQIPHGYLAPLLFDWKDYKADLSSSDFCIVINAIYYHHIRDHFTKQKIIDFSKKYLQDNANQYLQKEVNLKIKNLENIYGLNGKMMKEDKWVKFAIIKGVLNRCDWAASGKFLVEEVAKSSLKEGITSSLKMKNNGQNPLRPLQEYMVKQSNSNIIVIASTGSGKTEGALLWLDDDKGFFTLPMKVSANSIYERVKQNYLKEVAVLHSDAFAYYESNNGELDDEFLNYQSAKNLAYPLTICTVDQIFKFAYKALGTEHFLATLRYSKVIIDELQSYDPKVLATIIYGLQLINLAGGKFAIITATLPPFILNDLKNCNYQYECFKHSIVDRHKIKIVNKDMKEDLDFIIEQAKTKKVLIICNTVASAQELYKLLGQYCANLYLLHSRYLKKDRSLLEKKVIEFSNGSENGICISTQIVEASLDIDFDILFTQLSTIDSLIQRMGRVYRNRRNESCNTNVYIYTAKYGIGSVYDRELVDRTLSKLYKYDDMIFDEDKKLECINQVYNLVEIKGTKYYKTYQEKLNILHGTKALSQNIAEVNEKFREISNIQLLPDCIFNENQDKIKQLVDQIKENKQYSLLKELENYCISYNAQILYSNKGKLVDKEEFVPGTAIHLTQSSYDFNEITLSGVGLVIDEVDDDENQIL